MLKTLLLLLLSISPETDLQKHVEQFTITSRDTGSPSINKAQEYIIRECKSLGLRVESQAMLVRGKECRNIIAWREGKDLNKVVVIGAHLDSYRSPGANDNASGSACVLDLAKRFYTRAKPKYTIAFHWYTGEEQGLLGSKFYTKYPILPKDDPDIKKHVFMLNFDMVGLLKFHPKMDNVDDVLIELYKKYPFAEDITFRTGIRSDHKSFDKVGVPVVWLYTGMHRDYHRNTDTAEKLNYHGMTMICEYAYDLVVKFMDDEIPDYILWQLPIFKR